MSNQQQETAAAWTLVFQSTLDGIHVEVHKRRRREFSVRIGRIAQRNGCETFVSHLPIRIAGHGSVTASTIAPIVLDLLQQAQQFIARHAQEDEDSYLELQKANQIHGTPKVPRSA